MGQDVQRSGFSERNWEELVTTALLGTDRRPVPDEMVPDEVGLERTGPDATVSDPATRVLELAAQHRAATQAGRRPDRCLPGPIPSGDRLTLAPETAQHVLGSLLVRPEPVLVNAWLAACVVRGLGAPPDFWPRLAGLAARSTGYDRLLLAQALGPRGQWFLQHHPQWSRLTVATAGEGGAVNRRGDPALALAAVQQSTSAVEALQLLLDSTGPWPPELFAAAGQLLASETLGSETSRAALLGLERLRRSVRLRIEIEQAFVELAPAGEHQSTGEAQP